jgi:hypothetical protein
MKTYDFFKRNTRELMDKKKCSLMEARIYASNFDYDYEEHKRGKKNGK